MTMMTIVVAMGVAAVHRNSVLRIVACGLALNLFYICHVGSDFMAGRFLAAPFMLAVLILCSADVFANSKHAKLLCATLLMYALINPAHPLSNIPTDSETCRINQGFSSIADERGYYSHTNNLIAWLHNHPLPFDRCAIAAKYASPSAHKPIAFGVVGSMGFITSATILWIYGG